MDYARMMVTMHSRQRFARKSTAYRCLPAPARSWRSSLELGGVGFAPDHASLRCHSQTTDITCNNVLAATLTPSPSRLRLDVDDGLSSQVELTDANAIFAVASY